MQQGCAGGGFQGQGEADRRSALPGRASSFVVQVSLCGVGEAGWDEVAGVRPGRADQRGDHLEVGEMLSCWSGGTAWVEQVGQTRLELQQLGAGNQVLAGGAGVAEAMRARRPAAPAWAACGETRHCAG